MSFLTESLMGLVSMDSYGEFLKEGTGLPLLESRFSEKIRFFQRESDRLLAEGHETQAITPAAFIFMKDKVVNFSFQDYDEKSQDFLDEIVKASRAWEADGFISFGPVVMSLRNDDGEKTDYRTFMIMLQHNSLSSRKSWVAEIKKNSSSEWHEISTNLIECPPDSRFFN